MKAYWINATEKTITEVDCTGLKELQTLVGGYIEAGKYWDSGDVLFCDEEGLLKGGSTWYRIADKEQPICGNGVVCGPEDDEEMTAPTFPLSALQAEVEFLTVEHVASWAKGNSSEPAIALYFPGEEPVVVARTGKLFRQGPSGVPPEGEL